MNSEAVVIKIGIILEKMFNNFITEEEAYNQIQKFESDKNLIYLLSNIQHYFDDSDIREKDAWYREMQNSEMKKLIELLKKNRPMNELLAISFLEYS